MDRVRFSERDIIAMDKKSALLALVTALAACGPIASEPTTKAEDLPASAVPIDASAGPSGADNMTWQFEPAGGSNAGTSNARLMYASYGSEGMALNLQCDGDTIYARLWRGQQRESWPFSLQSGAARADLNGTTEGESEVIVTATLPSSAPVMNNFRISGDLTLIDDGRAQVLDAIDDQERQAIASFFTACS
jgi:hypothetical protein